jgi:hypothetical protein
MSSEFLYLNSECNYFFCVECVAGDVNTIHLQRGSDADFVVVATLELNWHRNVPFSLSSKAVIKGSDISEFYFEVLVALCILWDLFPSVD